MGIDGLYFLPRMPTTNWKNKVVNYFVENYLIVYYLPLKIEIESNKVGPNNHWMNPCSGSSFPQESPYQLLKQFVNSQ
jgi:hypothetical protein